jgi:lipid-A-disaccharide synthase
MSMHTQPLKIYLIAGEPSGDFLGASLMHALRTAATHPVEFAGIGGPDMAAQGLSSLFDYSEISLLGAAELIPHLPNIFRRIDQTVEHILEFQPDIVVSIDSPGFAKRVVKRVRNERRFAGQKPKLVHMVAPSVWAYKPKRAEEFAALYDKMLALLPFEPPYFEAAGLPCSFIGHPVAWEWRNGGDGESFRSAHGYTERVPLLGVFLGSRSGEIIRHWPIFRAAVMKLSNDIPDLACILPVPPARRRQVEALLKQEGWPTQVTLVNPHTEKKAAFAAMNAALAKSGTVSLELALAGVPQIVAYRVAAFTAWLVRRWISIPYVSLPNILSKTMIVPELLQQDCTPNKLYEALKPLLADEALGEAQIAALKPALGQLLPENGYSPSALAAKELLALQD